MKRLLILAVGLLWSLLATAQPLPGEAPVPGGVIAVKLGPAVDPAPRVHLGHDRVMVLRHADSWYAIVGIPLTLAPGTHQLTITTDIGSRSHDFTVQPKEYTAQHITLKNQRLVDPTPSDLQRIEQEQLLIREAFARWSETEAPAVSFDLPARGRLSGVFGTRRFFNKQERAPHNGIDLAAPRGAPVVAPADGTVVALGDYFFNGRSVFVDHGQGLVTMYNHLDRIAVAVGEFIKRGDRIGDIGMTGRTTGPHLHWVVSLNNARVDPMLFLSDTARKQ
jgi:murein DD-endopeptidase MepM/ murein hydrolase activator NlpD